MGGFGVAIGFRQAVAEADPRRQVVRIEGPPPAARGDGILDPTEAGENAGVQVEPARLARLQALEGCVALQCFRIEAVGVVESAELCQAVDRMEKLASSFLRSGELVG